MLWINNFGQKFWIHKIHNLYAVSFGVTTGITFVKNRPSNERHLVWGITSSRLRLITDAKQSKTGQNCLKLTKKTKITLRGTFFLFLVGLILIRSRQRDNLHLDKCLVIPFFMTRSDRAFFLLIRLRPLRWFDSFFFFLIHFFIFGRNYSHIKMSKSLFSQLSWDNVHTLFTYTERIDAHPCPSIYLHSEQGRTAKDVAKVKYQAHPHKSSSLLGNNSPTTHTHTHVHIFTCENSNKCYLI